MANSTVCQSKWKPIVEPRRAKPKTYRQAPTHWLKFYEEAVIESEARTAVVQLKSEAKTWIYKYCLSFQSNIAAFILPFLWSTVRCSFPRMRISILFLCPFTLYECSRTSMALWDHENLFETAVVRATEGYY